MLIAQIYSIVYVLVFLCLGLGIIALSVPRLRKKKVPGVDDE